MSDTDCIKLTGCTTCSGPKPPRLWSRFKVTCPLDDKINSQKNLDERRKWEILQYRKNSESLTKKQKFSQFSKGSISKRGQTFAVQNQSFTNPNLLNLKKINNTLYCKSGRNNCSLTTSSDVPGPKKLLCFKPQVTLYNLKTVHTFKSSGTSWPQTRGP
jgi:hypothetical protein